MSNKGKSKTNSSKKKKPSSSSQIADDLKLELTEERDKYLRLFADFEIFKK